VILYQKIWICDQKLKKIHNNLKFHTHKKKDFSIFSSVFSYSGVVLNLTKMRKLNIKKEYPVTVFHFFYKRMLQKKKKKYFCQDLDSVFSLVTF